jgi:hypothetical protein
LNIKYLCTLKHPANYAITDSAAHACYEFCHFQIDVTAVTRESATACALDVPLSRAASRLETRKAVDRAMSVLQRDLSLNEVLASGRGGEFVQ